MDLELALWREACQHLDIEECVGRMFPILERHLGASGLALRRLDRPRARLDTVTAAGDMVGLGPALVELGDARERAAALALIESGTVFLTELDPAQALFGPSRGATSARTIVVPLTGEADRPEGVLAILGSRAFTGRDVELVRKIAEPFAVALANDQRVHELARLREAALAENRALLTRLHRRGLADEIVGAGAGLRQVMERVEQVAKTDVPVLVLGETGSGKELIARAIHERSARRDGPMVRVNCGAIPPELVDSELFGHERGSFTGAVAQRKGWFERADGGTLLLDEVGELPPAAQVRLLRILQEGALERVGATRTIHVEVRIVAATHRDLHAMVSDGRFREDLWYRLAVFPLRLPSLRERIQDLPALATHFARRAGERLGAGPLVPTTQDLGLLRAYPWPGNVRELAAVIDRAAILGHARRLEIAAALGATASPAAAPSLAPRSSPPPSPIGARLEDVVVSHIEHALEATRGRIEGPHGAAVKLGVNPHTLRARMRKLGIDWARYRSNTEPSITR
jgi:transcriptional regulator with GAF, ATPase, and Fis domain